MTEEKQIRRRSPLYWGALFITLGLGVLLQRNGIFDFEQIYFSSIVAVLLIIIGIGFLNVSETAKKIISTLSGIIVAVFILSLWCSMNICDSSVTEAIDSMKDDIKYHSRKQYSVYDEEPRDTTNLIVRTDLIDLDIFSISTKIFDFRSEEGTDYSCTSTNNPYGFELSESKYDDTGLNGTLQLNDSTVWNMNLAFDAGNCKANFSRLKLSNLIINAGPSDLTLTLGNKPQKGEILIESTASSITISLPANAYCELYTNTFATSIPKDFTKVNSGFYKAGNDSSSTSYHITISGDVSVLRINRLPQ